MEQGRQREEEEAWLRTQARARQGEKKRADEIREKERTRAEKRERQRQRALQREEQRRLRRIREEGLSEAGGEESLELEDYPQGRKRKSEIESLQDRVREEGEQLLGILERRYQADSSRRQRPQRVPSPPSYESSPRGRRMHMPSDRKRREPRSAEPDYLDQVYQEWEAIDGERHRGKSVFD